MSIHRFVLTDGLNPVESGLNNGLLCVCSFCQYPVLTFVNQHNSPLTLTNVIIDTASFGNGLAVYLWDINGNPISYPYTVFEGGSIQITFEVCYNFVPTSAFSITLVTAEHNSDQAYEFDTECVEISDFFSALSIDFGNVPADTTATETIQFTNNSMAPYVVTVDFEGCGAVGLTMVPSAVTVQPGETVDLDFEWTPLNEGQTLNCAGYSCNAGLLFTGISTAAPLIHRLEIISGGLDPEGTNYLNCCVSCQNTFVTFQNTHNTAVTLDDFIITDAGSGVNVSFVGFSGQPPSWPVLSPGQTVVFEFEVCYDGVTDPLSAWTFQLVTLEHGNELPYTFNMECVDLPSLFNSTTFDFTDTVINSTNTKSVTVNNITIGELLINLDTSGCGSPEPQQFPYPTTISQGQIGLLTLTWSPTDLSNSALCTISNYCGVDFNVTASVFEEPCGCLCCLDIEIQTEGNYLPPQSGFCDTELLYSTASFLEQKTFVFKMKYDVGLVTGWSIQFNPSLFSFTCAEEFDGTSDFPTKYYFQYLSGAHPDGVAQTMNLVGAGMNALNLKNWEVKFRPVNAINGTFNIEFTFYMLQDYETFLSNITWPNLNKFKRSTISSPTDWLNTFASVYNIKDKFLHAAFLLTDPATLVDASPFKCMTYTCTNYAARFYNKSLGDNVPEFLNHSFTLSRNGLPVSDFSILQNTQIGFEVDIPAIYGNSASVVIFHLFNVSVEDNNVDFLSSSDSSRARVFTFPGTGVLDNHLVRPSIFSSGGGTCICTMHVDSNLNLNDKYRVAAIVYGSAGTMVNTFISQEIGVTNLPTRDCDCKPEVTSEFGQYWQLHPVNCFRPVGKERINHRVTVTSGDFILCMRDIGIIMTDWRSQLQSVRLNIYKRKQNFPTNSQTTFFQYASYQSVRTPGFFGGFNNLGGIGSLGSGGMVVQDSGANEVDIFTNNIRVPWESNLFSPSSGQVLVANNSSYMLRTSAGALSASYVFANNIDESWINEDIYFEYVFGFDLEPQVGETFIWNVVKAFKVSAIDFEPANSGFDQVLTDVTIEGIDPATGIYVPIEEPICYSDYESIKLTYQANREGNFIFFMEPEPYGKPYLVENNEAFSPAVMAQQSNPRVISMDTSFDPVTLTASVILDSQTLVNNKKYRFCGYISFPDAAAICEYFTFHRDHTGSGISMASLTVGDSFQLIFNNSSENRYRYGVSQVGETPAPVPGQTYVLEYSFNVPTTRIVEFWGGQWSFSGVPQVTLPIGSTSGNVSFVWGAAIGGEWTIRITTGTNMTAIGTFKIGNALCP
jgi:hypothetical protein